VPHRPRISPFESTRIDLSRVRSQYFFNFCPTLFAAPIEQKNRSRRVTCAAMLRVRFSFCCFLKVDLVVETDFGGALVDEMLVDVAVVSSVLNAEGAARDDRPMVRCRHYIVTIKSCNMLWLPPANGRR
jgi:hypothetical protein